MEERNTTHENSTPNGQALNESSLSAFYERNNRVSFILKKTEKITTAIYMVTDFMSESEPLRPELRTLAIMLLSKTRQLSIKATEPDYSIVEDLKHGTDNICSFINLAVTIGLVSSMNGGILIKELEKNSKELHQIYNDRRVSVTTHPGYANIILTEDLFKVQLTEIPKINVLDKGQEYNGQQKIEHVLYKKPELDRPYKTPAIYLVGSLGVGFNIFLMCFVRPETWVAFLIWGSIGIAVYFLYSRRNSNLHNVKE